MHNFSLEIVKNYCACSVSVTGILLGVTYPDFLIISNLVSLGASFWVLRRVPGLRLKSELAAAQHRTRWRDGVLAEVDRTAKSLQEQLEEKAQALQETELALREKARQYQQWEQMLIAAEQKFGEVLESNKAYYEELLQHQQQDFLSEIQLRENTIALLQNKIMRIANRPDPKQGFAAWVAALLLEALEQHEVYCRLVSYQKIPGSREVSIWVDLEPGQQSRKLEAIAKEVGSWVKLGEPSITWDGDECIYEFHFAPNAFYEDELIGGIDEAAGVIIEEPQGDYLAEFIRNTDRLSAFINGDSGSGKSTFVNNYICLIKRIFEEDGELVEVIIVDGKDPDSPWEIDGVQMIPQYGGINDPDDEDEENWIENDCLAGLQVMKQDVYHRLRAKRKARDEGQPMPTFPKRIYVVDEAEEIYSIYSKDASKPILSAARLGRSGGIAVVVIGQNSNCSAYGFQIPNLNNFVRAYLRENAKKGIKDAVPTASDRKPLLQQVSARESISKGLPKSDPRKYWGFFKIAGEPGFVAQLPPPNAYSVSGDQLTVDTSPLTVNSQQSPAAKPRTIIEAVEDAKLIEAIKKIKITGEGRLTEIISKVWGVEVGSRAYRKAREEYRRLTGE
ncbi:hypothetical protein [Scytonema sp. PCC 10023]|uniref:hypothetical protein n=1 Tax=Scytonema sp. PCC 10023 TaxID=1680591 RepID=UPI0039C5D620